MQRVTHPAWAQLTASFEAEGAKALVCLVRAHSRGVYALYSFGITFKRSTKGVSTGRGSKKNRPKKWADAALGA